MAGGPTKWADLDRIKLAKKIKDGDTLWVRKKKSTRKHSKAVQSISLISINTAEVDTLIQLPGIGPKTAHEWVKDRRKKTLVSIHDLNRVPGIGQKTIDRIRPFIKL